MEDYETMSKAADLAGVDRQTIARWVKLGKLAGKNTTRGNLVATLVSVARVRKLKAEQPRGRPSGRGKKLKSAKNDPDDDGVGWLRNLLHRPDRIEVVKRLSSHALQVLGKIFGEAATLKAEQERAESAQYREKKVERIADLVARGEPVSDADLASLKRRGKSEDELRREADVLTRSFRKRQMLESLRNIDPKTRDTTAGRRSSK
jgi:hypothetical protein